ncbi:hypothetical protein JCM30760_19630 [Thiomicrorhabdus hydrogeniphila]
MKNFHFDGPTWAFLTPEQMYDEEGKLRQAHKHYQNADIYFLSIMNKCFFNPKKTKVSIAASIKCEISVGDPAKKMFDRISVSYSLAEVLYSMPGINDRFRSRDEFLFFVLFQQYQPKTLFKRKLYNFSRRLLTKNVISKNSCFKILRAIYSSDIGVRHETRFEINIFDPLVDCITNNEKAEEAKKRDTRFYDLNEADWDTSKTKEIDYSKLPGAGDFENCRLTINQIINHFDIKVGNQKIAYIGKTEQEPFDRLFPHKKLNKLNAKLLKNEYETLIIHLFGFKNWDTPILSIPPKTTISESDAITIAEAELINYFKPPENDTYVKDNGKHNWKHIQLLLKNGFKNIRGLLDVDGQYAKFYTPHVGKRRLNRHEIDINLDDYRSVQPKNTVDSQTHH